MSELADKINELPELIERVEKLPPEGDEFIVQIGYMNLCQLADLKALAASHRELEERLAAAEAVIDHYDDESFWDDPVHDSGYGGNTQYNYEDEILHQIPGYEIAREYLRKYPKKNRKKIRGE